MNILNEVLANNSSPKDPATLEPLFIVKSEKLYLHIDLIVTMSEYFKEHSEPIEICQEELQPVWGKESILHKKYRCRILPSLKREYNMAIENAKWLSGLYLGELKKNQTKYITMVSVLDKDCQILRNEKNPKELIIKIAHEATCPRINTYEAITSKEMKYHLNRDGYRYCSECEQELVLNSDNFYSDKSKAQGFQHTCIECVKKKRQEKYHAQKAKIEK